MNIFLCDAGIGSFGVSVTSLEDVFMALGADTVTLDTDSNDNSNTKQYSISNSSSKAAKVMHTVMAAVASSAAYVANSVRTMIHKRRHRAQHSTAIATADVDTVEMISMSTVTTATAAPTTSALHKHHAVTDVQCEHDTVDIDSPIHSATTTAAVGLLTESSEHNLISTHSNGVVTPINHSSKYAEYTSNSSTKSSSNNKRPNSANMIRHLLYKRYTVFKRDKKGLFFQMILPGASDTHYTYK